MTKQWREQHPRQLVDNRASDPESEPYFRLLTAMVLQAREDARNGSRGARREACEWLQWAQGELAEMVQRDS